MAGVYALIGKKIRNERFKCGMSIEELADRAGITPSFLGQIERGEKKLSVATLIKVAQALHVACGVLIDETEVSSRPQWEDKIARLIEGQSSKHKELLFKTLKYFFRHLQN